MNNDDVWNSNNIDSIDKKINQSAKDNLDGLEVAEGDVIYGVFTAIEVNIDATTICLAYRG